MIYYYDILGISQQATDAEIRAAYHTQIKIFHPDRYNSSTHPTGHALALAMTWRLNEARDVLLDPVSRAAYDATLSRPWPRTHPRASPPPRPRPQASPPSRAAPLTQPTRSSGRLQQIAFWTTIATAFILGGLATRPAPQSYGQSLGAASAATPVCPTGEPSVTVDHVTVLPDPDSFTQADIQNRRLYVVSGQILNTTNATIAVTALGFYLGTSAIAAPPDWTETLANTDTIGDPNSIPPGGVLTWKSRDPVDWDVATKGPHPATVAATVSFPYADSTQSEPQWVANSCQ